MGRPKSTRATIHEVLHHYIMRKIRNGGGTGEITPFSFGKMVSFGENVCRSIHSPGSYERVFKLLIQRSQLIPLDEQKIEGRHGSKYKKWLFNQESFNNFDTTKFRVMA